jgi:hypothetical protein
MTECIFVATPQSDYNKPCLPRLITENHDRIKATRNSALDLRAGLNFLNSLLLPLLAFVLGNFDKILAYFS